MDALHQLVAVGEIAAQEPDQRVAGHGLVGRVHGDFAEKVFGLGVQYDQRAQSVPEVVQRIDALGVAAGLVGGLHERTPQFDGPGQELPAETLAETEIVFGREMAGVGRGADDEAVTADDLLRRGVPDDQLVVAVAGEVLRVDVHLLTRAAAWAASRRRPTSRMSEGHSAAEKM